MGARGDGHSSCHGSLASQCGLLGFVAKSTANNTAVNSVSGVQDYPKIAVVLYENIIKFYLSVQSCSHKAHISVSILGCFMSAGLDKVRSSPQ